MVFYVQKSYDLNEGGFLMETYCGKSCEECTQREELCCPGCKEGPGRSFGGECKIAQCCRQKGHETCNTCAFQGTCPTLRGRFHQVEYMRWDREAQQRQQEELVRRVPFLRHWLWILFWLIVPSVIASILGNENLATVAPKVYFVGSILGAVCSIAYGGILLKLSQEEERYRVAGLCTLIPALINALLLVFSRGGEMNSFWLIIVIPAAIVRLVGEYYEFTAHSAVLVGIDDILSDKWTTLWKCYVGFMAGVIGSMVLLLILPIIGLIAFVVGGIGLIVVSIMKLVYLYRTATAFKNFAV